MLLLHADQAGTHLYFSICRHGLDSVDDSDDGVLGGGWYSLHLLPHRPPPNGNRKLPISPLLLPGRSLRGEE